MTTAQRARAILCRTPERATYCTCCLGIQND